MRLERSLMKLIDQQLGIYEMSGEVAYWIRINAGRVKTYYGSYLRLANKGTPDYLALIRNRQDNITALFIEAKSDTGKLRKDQKEFQIKYNKRKDINTITIKDIKELINWIEKNAKDFVSQLPSSL